MTGHWDCLVDSTCRGMGTPIATLLYLCWQDPFPARTIWAVDKVSATPDCAHWNQLNIIVPFRYPCARKGLWPRWWISFLIRMSHGLGESWPRCCSNTFMFVVAVLLWCFSLCHPYYLIQSACSQVLFSFNYDFDNDFHFSPILLRL